MAASVPQTPGGSSNFAQWVEMDLSLANAAALQRLTAAAEYDPANLRRRRHRSLKLIVAIEVWALVAMLVVQTHLY
jgi:hypothetical protein